MPYKFLIGFLFAIMMSSHSLSSYFRFSNCLSKSLHFLWSCVCFHSFSGCSIKNFDVVVYAENGNVVLLSRSFLRNCSWSLKCFRLDRGVFEQPQLKFLLRIVDAHMSLLFVSSFWMLFIKFFSGTISEFYMLSF